MSKNNNTEAEETEEKATVRIAVSEAEADQILSKIGAPFPPAKDLTEIHLIIKKDQ